MIRKKLILSIDLVRACKIFIPIVILLTSIGCSTNTIEGLDGAFFGDAVVINKSGVLIGAPGGVGGGGALDGLAYLFVPNTEGWILSKVFKAGHPKKLVSYDYFGESLSFAENIALIGAWGNDDDGPASGSAHIFEPTLSNWQQSVTLSFPETGERAIFGKSVATDGNVVVVGAPGANRSIGKLIPISGWSGNVYVWSKDKSGWQFQQKLTPELSSKPSSMDDWVFNFGDEVAVAGDIIAVSAHEGTSTPGQVYIYRRHNNTWRKEAVLEAKAEAFATSIAMSNETIAVAAANTVYIYVYYNKNWLLKAKFEPNAFGEDTGFQYGGALAIDDNILVAGAARFSNKRGATYVFERFGSDWKQTAILTASDSRPSRGNSSGDLFGQSVSIYGHTIVVGASYHDSEGPNNGAAYIFVREGNKWIQKSKLISPKLTN